MTIFRTAEVWSDVACNSGVRLGAYPLAALVECTATYAIDGQETLTIAVAPGAPGVSHLAVGRVIRLEFTASADFEEWRIADIGTDSASRVTRCLCYPISYDLSRALYTATDGVGAPTHEFSVIQIDVEGVIDGPVREALDDAGLPWIVKGTIEPTGEVDLTVDYATARSLILDTLAKTGGELRLRRNGTTDYRIDVLDSIGSTAAVPTLRTARNLLGTSRIERGGEGGTRVIPRGADNSTHRGVGYAYWEVTATPSATTARIRDPRGAGFPAPVLFDDQANGWWVSRIVPTFAAVEVTDSAPDALPGESLLTFGGSHGLTAGDLIEFRLANSVTGRRVWALPHPGAITATGVFDRVLDRSGFSGVVNYAPNPFVRDYTGSIRIDNASGASGLTTTGGSPVVGVVGGSGAATGIQVGDRLYRTSDDALVGTVLTVDSTTQVTLTADALVIGTNFDFYALKDAPAGASSGTLPNQRFTLTSQVASSVQGVDSFAWRIERPLGTDGMEILITPFPNIPTSTATPFNIWCWIEIVAPASGPDIDVKLLRADTFAQIGATVTIPVDTDTTGRLIRAQFSGLDLSAATAGVVIQFTQTSGSASDYRLGPWGVQPSAWALTDVETPRACDLWHEGNLWLQSSRIPVGYDIDLSDLYAIDSTRWPFDALTLGGDVLVVDTDLGVQTTQRLISIQRNHLIPGDTRLVLGTRQKGLVEYLADQSTATVGDFALGLSRGLIRQAQIIQAQPRVTATEDGITVEDPEPVFETGDAIRTAFPT